jgi:hypothetical protein
MLTNASLRRAVQSGGSVRGYQESQAQTVIRITVEQAGGQAACFSLSHKRRVSIGAGLALEIMVYAAEFPSPAP